MRLQLRAAAIAAGIFWAVLVGGVGLLNWWFGDYGAAFLHGVSSIYPGFEGDGALADVGLGALYALVDGAIGGLLLAWLYNLAARPE